jgi:hypothetical protein
MFLSSLIITQKLYLQQLDLYTLFTPDSVLCPPAAWSNSVKEALTIKSTAFWLRQTSKSLEIEYS